MVLRTRRTRCLGFILPVLAAAAACAAPGTAPGPSTATTVAPESPIVDAQVLRGRHLVVTHDCGGCHGGLANPAAAGWLAGEPREEAAFPVGPFRAWPSNLTPDDETGTGKYTERQIFNAMRWGLRPSTTPDVEITSQVPGEGNHPVNPDYLSPAMPWIYWRFMPDQDLRDIAAYLKRGVKPVTQRIMTSEAPPDLWAGEFAIDKIGTRDLPPFPAAHETEPAPEKRESVLRGRQLVARSACAGCHGGANKPDQDGWLTGMLRPEQEFQIGPFKTRPRNLTPHNTTGMGRFTERQIFNSLRFGLRPGETPDVEITSTTPGEGNFPVNPKYLAPPMPWIAWRHMSDQQLRDIAAYLKHGVRPAQNRVPDSEGPPDFWLEAYSAPEIGGYPVDPFPTANERLPVTPAAAAGSNR